MKPHLVSGETTREVVQIGFGPGKLVEACRVQHLFEPLVSNKRGRQVVQRLAVNILVDRHVVQTHVLPGKLVQARRVKSSLNQLGSGWFINSLTPQACTSWGKRTTFHLVSHLGGVAASIGTFSRAGVYTLARACASAW